jgi:hypothetical protein
MGLQQGKEGRLGGEQDSFWEVELFCKNGTAHTELLCVCQSYRMCNRV